MNLKKNFLPIIFISASIALLISLNNISLNNTNVVDQNNKVINLSTTNMNKLINCSSNFFDRKINNDTANRDIISGLVGDDILGLRLYNINGEISNEKNFTINNNQVWDKFISIVHDSNYSAAYKIILLVDYKKTSFLVDGSLQNEFSFDLKPYQVIDIPIQIKNLSLGFHDILFIIVKKPENKTEEFSQVNFLRYTISEKSNVSPNYEYINLNQKEIVKPMGDIFLSTGNSSYSKKVLKLNYNFEYYVGVQSSRNIFKNSQKCALITLLDWSPIGKVQFFSIQKNKEILIKNSLKLTKEGKHVQSAILVLSPYEKYNNIGWFTYSSTVASINVIKQ
jgi:hypothetical protein